MHGRERDAVKAALISPTSGARLRADTLHSLSDGLERWPMVDAIPYLRTGREDVVRGALACLDAGDRTGALVGLLADQDDWWDGPPPLADELSHLVAARDGLSLREAMALLGYGRVADYFAHRWSDPTFLAGLALLESHWAAPAGAFELACGIGHYLRELALHGVEVAGADVVFSKLWLARHWVVGPGADLVCFDAASAWPVRDLRADLILCQDAFYFLEPKREILAGLRRAAGSRGVVAIGHVHNRDAPNLSAGAGLRASDLADLFPDGILYDDAELTRAAAEARAPRPAAAGDLAGVEAFSVVAGPGVVAEPKPVSGRLTLPRPRASLRLNPLYEPCPDGRAELVWPSERYRREYGDRATYPPATRAPAAASFEPSLTEAARRRELVALPERW